MRILPYFGIFATIVFLSLSFADANAQDVNDVVDNIQTSSVSLSGLMSAMSYLTGVLLATLGIMKTIDHVSNPSQTPIRMPIARFLIGGSLFALPIVLESAYRTINGVGADATLAVDNAGSPLVVVQTMATLTAAIPTTFNAILASIVNSTSLIPGLVSMIGYMMGILLAISGLLKIREHVDEPERTKIKEPVIRLLIAGALFALPTVFNAMYETIANGGFGAVGTLFMTNSIASFVFSSDDTGGFFGGANCTPAQYAANIAAVFVPVPGVGTIGDAVCNLEYNISGLPIFLTALSYVLGLVFGLWGLFKIKDHVLDPAQTKLSEPVTRLLAGGAFFAMPFIVNVLSYTVTPIVVSAFQGAAPTNTGYGDNASIICPIAVLTGVTSLDTAFVCLMYNVMGPLQVFTNFFCFVAGMIFIMIGISRIIRSSQEGARGPGGRGTVATFLIGGILISANALMRSVSASLFVSPVTKTTATLAYTGGMTLAETQATYNVIAGVLRFMLIIGFISFVRGIFIMRDVAEGNQQASTMAGITHIIGGALAVNLGPLLNAIQTTLGVTAFGISFS